MSFFSRSKAPPSEPNPLAKPYQRKAPAGSHAPPPPASSSRADPSSGVPPPPKGSQPPPPPPRSTLTPQQQRLATLTRLSAQLDSLTATLALPPKLRFAPSSTIDQLKLTFDSSNRPALELDDALTKILLALDGVDSDGDDQVRDERKKLVKRVEAEIERLEQLKREQWIAQSAAGQIQPSAVDALPEEERDPEVDDSLGKLNGRLPPRSGGGTPDMAAQARIYQHVGPEHGWNDAPPTIVRRTGADATSQAGTPPAARNKRASMRRPPPTQFY